MTSSDTIEQILSRINIDSIRTYVSILNQKDTSQEDISAKLSSVLKLLEWAYYSDKISFTRYQQIKDEIDSFSLPVINNAFPEASAPSSSIGTSIEGIHTPKKNSVWGKFFPSGNKLDSIAPLNGVNTSVSSLRNQSTLFISAALLLVGLSIIGQGIYGRFFSNTKASLAFPSTPVVASRILSFQGRLTDSLGNPITASTNMRFRLYTASSGGTTLYDSGTCSIAPDQDGVHNVLIGSDCGSEVASSVFTENGTVYLGVTVGADSEMTPRQRMANVPYAQNSETLQGLPLGKDASSVPYINNGGDLLISAASPQIGSTYASQTFVVSSAQAVTLQSAGTGDVTLTATGSGELKFLVGGSTAGVVNNSGNWGIKSSNPSTFELQVNGDVGPETDSAFDLGSNSVRWANVYADNIVGTFTTGFTQGSVTFADGSGNLAQDNAQFFFDDTNNRLGIGTAVPLGKFHVTGASTGKALAILNETGDQNILTASASGTTVANLDRSGNLSVEGTLSDLSGATLDVNDNLDISGTLTSGTANAFGVDATGNISTSGTTGLSFTSTGGIVLAGGTITDGTDGVDINDDLEIAGGTTLGDASGDTVTANAASWTFANDTNYILSGGINGLSLDSTTFSVDATNDRIGIGTAAPDAAWLDIAAATTGKSQLNLTTSAGTNVSAPNSGDMWWNGTNLYFYNGSTNNDLLASGGSVAGSDTQVQYNNGGSFGGASALIYDDVNNRIGIGSATSPTSIFHVAGATTGKALAIFNETGDQNILTASASGTTIANLDRSGNLSIEGSLSDLSGTVLNIDDGLSIAGNTTFGDASGDTVTSNAATWTFANDTDMTLTGGVNGLSFDGTTFSVDSTNNRIGIGTAAPSSPLTVSGGTGGTAIPILSVTQTDNSGQPPIASFIGTGGGTIKMEWAGNITLGDSNNMRSNGYNQAFFGFDGAGSSIVNGQSSVIFKTFSGSNIERMRIANAGNVGIGNASPVGFLDVSGKVTGKALTILNETGDQALLTASASGTTRYTLANNGNITYSPSAYGTPITLYASDTTLPNANTGIVDAINDAYTAAIGGGGGLWTDSGTTTYLTTTTDDIVLGGSAPLSSGKLSIDGDADQIQLIVQGNGTQTSSLAVFEQSDGTDVLTISNAGNLAFAGGTLSDTSDGVDIADDLEISGGTTLGDASGDTVTANAAAWTFANDTTVALSGGLNGLNFDSNTLSIDAANDKIGIGTAAPVSKIHVTGAVTGKALAIFDETGDQDIIAASGSGSTRFRVANDGTIYGGYFLDISNTAYGIDPAGTSNFGGYSMKVTGGALLAADSGNVGIGDQTPDAKLNVQSTTEQLRLDYDDSNYTSFTVSSGGDLTIAPTGGDIAVTGNGDFSGGLNVASSNHFNIDSSGNIGIGTTAASGYGLRMSKSIDSSTMSTYYLDHKAVTYSGIPSGSYYQGDAVAITNNTTSGGPYHTVRSANFANSASTWQGYSASGYSAYLSNDVAANSAYFTGYGSTTVNASTATAQEYTNYLSGTTNQVGGTISIARGFRSTINNASTGTISTVYNFLADTPTNASGTITTAYGAYIADQSVGTNTTAYGVYIANQSGSSGNAIGLYVADADDYSIQLASTDGDAASGITFGTDTNLYRSAADTLKTDDAFTAVGNITTSGDLAVNGDDITSDGNLTLNATGYTRVGDTASPASANGDDDLFVEGDLEVDGVMYLDGTLDTSFTAGSVVFAGTSGVLAQDNSSFFFDDTNNRLGIGDTTPDTFLDITGTTAQLRLSYETGDTNYTTFTTSSGGDLTIAPSGADTNITGNLAVSGNSGLGDADADTTTITGKEILNFDATSLGNNDHNALYINASRSSSTASTLRGLNVSANYSATSGTQTGMNGLDFTVQASGNGGTVTTMKGISAWGIVGTGATVGTFKLSDVANPSNSGTITSLSGYSVDSLTSGTNNTLILAGTTSIPSGNWGIYNTSSYTNYLSGTTGIGTTGADAKLDVLSTTEQLRLTYTDGSAYSSFTTDSSGDLTIDPTGGDIVADANFNPNTHDTYDLGTDGSRWRDLYLGPDTLHVGTSTTDEGTLKYVTSTNVLTLTNNFGDTDFGSTSDGFNFTLGGGAGDDFIVDATTLVVESDNDRVGIGTAAPDAAWLDIAAATTAKAQINLTTSAATDVSAPASGDLWWNGTNLYFYNGSINKDLLAAGAGGPWTDGGSYVYTTAGEVLNLGGVTGTAYHAISDSGTTSHGLASDDDLFVEGDFEVDGTLFADGSITSAGTITGADFACTDCLDFAELEDTLDLDTALTLNQGTNTWTQNFTGDTTTGLTYNANSLSTGTAVAINSTSTAYTAATLLSLDWSPGSLVTSTDDLFKISTTNNGNLSSAYYINLIKQGSSIFNIAQSGNVTTTGDIAINGDDITSDGDLTVDAAGGQFLLADADTINIGGVSALAYNAIADSGGATSHSLASDDDLFVEGDTEVNGTLFADGETVLTTVSGAGLSDCDSATSILLWDSTAKQFSCGRDNDLVSLGWTDFNVANSLTDSQLDRPLTTILTGAVSEVYVPFAGNIVGISVSGNAARTNGSATFTVFKNDATTGFTCVINGTKTQYNNCTQASGTDTFAAGDYIDVRVTTDLTWAPTTTEFTVDVWIEMDTGADVAELYNIRDGTIKSADIVAIDPTLTDGVMKSSGKYDTNMIGVIATKPGVLLGKNDVQDIGASRAVALTGRVPVSVTTENGPIRIGDAITSSSIPGVGMKSTRAARVVGRALSEWDNPDPNVVGTVMIFVEPAFDARYILTDMAELFKDAQQTIIAESIMAQTLITDTFSSTKATIVELVATSFSADSAKITDADIKRLNAEALKVQELEAEKIKTKTLEAQDIITTDIASTNIQADRIVADNVDAKNITEMRERLERLAASQSDSTVTSEQLDADLEQVQQYIDELTDSQSPENITDVETYQLSPENIVVDPGTTESSLGENVSTANLESLIVTGTSTMTSLTVADAFSAGNVFIQNNSVVSMVNELKLTALETVDIMNGGVIIAKDGTLTAKGEVIAQKGIRSNTIKSLDGNSDVSVVLNGSENTTDPASSFKVQNSDGNDVALIDSKGSADFKNLSLSTYSEATSSAVVIAARDNYRLTGLYAPAIKTNAAASGNGILPSGENDIIIFNDLIKKDTIVNLSPTSSSENQSVYIDKVEACLDTENQLCKPYFRIAIDNTISKDVTFNWLLVN